MTDLADLRSAVTSRYAVQQLPEWPAPWPDGEPDDDAYSRLTDPLRFEILFRRADAWVDELTMLPGITVEDLEEPGSGRHGRTFVRGRRVASDRPGAAPLLVLEEDEPAACLAEGHLLGGHEHLGGEETE